VLLTEHASLKVAIRCMCPDANLRLIVPDVNVDVRVKLQFDAIGRIPRHSAPFRSECLSARQYPYAYRLHRLRREVAVAECNCGLHKGL
jgi:hypothetical protein